MSKFLVLAESDGIYEALHAAGVFAEEPKNVRRVVIDLQAGQAAKAYVELFLDDSIIDVILRGSVEFVFRSKEDRAPAVGEDET